MNCDGLRVRSLALLGLPDDADVGDAVPEIVPGEEGEWIIWTLSESIYLVHWSPQRRELFRFPRWETVWVSDDTGQEIQIDARPLPIIELVQVRIGERGRFRVDSGQLGRDNTPLNSTPVVAIYKLTVGLG